MDKLKVLQKLAYDKGSSARIFKALADPPTTSLQRLKGLTTGGLPTFIDVGNSFGAPAIVEDNLIHQLVQNGKRVLMMGDDTWLQLFPDHFEKSYPYPSFNVKDLHTVDDGCIKHLLPSLYREDWDVLIAHFLGVDHAGHIFGVDSSPMVEKLEQYNAILEKVTEVLKNQSGPGDLHENTFLLVMGDHGQTTNGDHGGGTAEEVETSLFAMSMKKSPASVPAALDSSVCKLDLDGNKMCFSFVQQLDFAVTVAALLGVPFPFGSIGRVNPEIYALAAGTWNQQSTTNTNCKDWLNLEEWMQNYAHVLCINSWQVKRYIDVYSASSVIGFSSEDLLHVEEIYAQALNNWSNSVQKSFLSGQETLNDNFASTLSSLEGQINTYSNFLASVAELARSKWTEFDLWMMGAGIGIMLFSLLVHFIAFRRAHMLCQATYPSVRASGISSRVVFAVFMVAMRACSFLSNSYILTEGKVANFLLGTTGILNLRYSIMENKMLTEAVAFLLLISISRFIVEIGLSKQAVSAMLMSTYPLRMLGIDESHFFWVFISEIVPILALVFLAYLLYTTTSGSSCWRVFKIIFTTATVLSYMLIAVHWALESNMLEIPLVLEGIGRNSVPRIIYAIGCGLLVLLAVAQLFKQKGKTSDYKEVLVIKTVTMLSAWSSTIIILLGRQGFLVSLVSIIAGWCIIRLENLEQDTMNGFIGATDILSVTQWSLLAVSLFYLTGHWCAFDGLRYGAAFIGFDEFILVRQAILLAIETFGASHILPILALPFLVSFKHQCCGSNKKRGTLFIKLSQVLLMYGLITAVTTSLTIVCVTIQRRHLMVWGLFAPKFVFDVVGLLLTDVLICLSSIYYFSGIDE
ncbi:PREDICTED: GPI ethanolamine phosphate transferase 3 isoform X2 [Nelumbo nucifera]|nr:PREDICTED: GPI ethanolamine phosphate transferase 3 isoform X2 [Nelumbo nucifera]